MSIKLPYKVKDTKSIQHNFDFLASKALSTDTRHVGPIQGDGAQYSNGLGQWRVMTGMVLTYKTGSIRMRAELHWNLRCDAANAAGWIPWYSGLNVSPAPISRLRGNAVAGNVPLALDLDIAGIGFTHSAGPTADNRPFWDTMLLLPNTTYTFQVLGAGGGGGAGTNVWNAAAAESAMVGYFWPEP